MDVIGGGGVCVCVVSVVVCGEGVCVCVCCVRVCRMDIVWCGDVMICVDIVLIGCFW